MSGVNKVILIGHLGKDPEAKTLENGKKVVNLTLATSESYKDKNGEKVDNVEWHNISFFGPAAEVIEKYSKKGSQLYVEGKLKTRSYEKDGEKRYVTSIQGDQFSFIGGNGGGTKAEKPSASSAVDETDDSLPF